MNFRHYEASEFVSLYSSFVFSCKWSLSEPTYCCHSLQWKDM